MSRETWIYDPIACEVVSKSEYASRQAARSDHTPTPRLFDGPVQRGSWVWDSERGELVERGDYYARKYAHVSPAPMVISDHMPGDTWHPATGRYTDSKSHFRKMTRQSGCVEVGNEPVKPPPRPQLNARDRASDIKQAMRNSGMDVL